MDRADARAGQHRDVGARDHRQIDHHAVALDDAEVAQHGREGRDLVEQLRVGDRLGEADHRRVVDDRRLVATARRDVTVDAVVARVQSRIGEPAAVDAALRVEDAAGRLDPVDRAGRLAPEGLGVGLPARVGLGIGRGLTIGHGVLPVGSGGRRGKFCRGWRRQARRRIAGRAARRPDRGDRRVRQERRQVLARCRGERDEDRGRRGFGGRRYPGHERLERRRATLRRSTSQLPLPE